MTTQTMNQDLDGEEEWGLGVAKQEEVLAWGSEIVLGGWINCKPGRIKRSGFLKKLCWKTLNKREIPTIIKKQEIAITFHEFGF
ncbi:MAG: hypothetical protein GX587_15835 [Bacteroidales bacterium]|nr:hypothetical protein [Bacteroidales bacterium]